MSLFNVYVCVCMHICIYVYIYIYIYVHVCVSVVQSLPTLRIGEKKPQHSRDCKLLVGKGFGFWSLGFRVWVLGFRQGFGFRCFGVRLGV